MTEVYLSLGEMAKALGVSAPTMRTYVDDEGAPVFEGGSNGKAYKFEPAAVFRWYAEREGRIARDKADRQAAINETQQKTLDLIGGDANGVDALSSKARRDYYVAEDARIRVGRQRGELVERAAVEATLRRVFAFVADRMQALPDDLERAADLPPAATAKLQESIDLIQGELADEVAAWQDEEEKAVA